MERGGEGGRRTSRRLMRITADDVFNDFKARRNGIIKALTSDCEEFYSKCDPDKGNLCLLGLPNEERQVSPPDEEVPPPFPEPTLGINFSRQKMEREDWFHTVAVYSDSWLLAVASSQGACLNRDQRLQLFSMINDLPTVYEIVTCVTGQQPITNFTVDPNPNTNKPESSSKETSLFEEQGSKLGNHGKGKYKAVEEEKLEEVDEEQEENFCGACGNEYVLYESWICCDTCDTWFHAQCVNVTHAEAKLMKEYKCNQCSNKRARTRRHKKAGSLLRIN